jgi:hypothetical protein
MTSLSKELERKHIYKNTNQLKQILAFSPLCIAHKEQTIENLIHIVKNLYGVSIDGLDIHFWNICYKAMCERFQKLTIHDLQLIFNESEIEKRPFVSLTREELLKPISEYYNKKQLIEQAQIDLIVEVKKQEESEKISRDFERESVYLYNKSLVKGVWLGDMFNANVLGKYFKGKCTEEQVERWTREAQMRYKLEQLDNKDVFKKAISEPQIDGKLCLMEKRYRSEIAIKELINLRVEIDGE